MVSVKLARIKTEMVAADFSDTYDTTIVNSQQISLKSKRFNCVKIDQGHF